MPEASKESGEAGAMREETVPVEMVHLLGLHVKSMGSRILLRCPYGTRYSYLMQVRSSQTQVVHCYSAHAQGFGIIG